MSVAIFTIVCKNYLPFARVLMESVRRFAPDARRLVVLADRPDGYFDPGAEDFEIVLSSELPIPNSAWFHFKHRVLELTTAVKPSAIEFLMDRLGCSQILYFDADIQIHHSLAPLRERLEAHSFLLTPHLTVPIPDDRRPSELDILRSGTYNLGFIAVRDCEESRTFLNWWQARVYDHCLMDLPSGLFVDQRWLDLAVGFFPGAGILREPGYNLAYWNLTQRRLDYSPDAGFRIGGEPLYFAHFSGLDPEHPDTVSRHQNRHRLGALGEPERTLFLGYAQQVWNHGYAQCHNLPYAFGFFDNGEPIPDAARQLYFRNPELAESAPDPFSEAGREALMRSLEQPMPSAASRVTTLGYRGRSIYSSLEGQEPVRARAPVPRNGPPLPKLSLAIYESRPDIQDAFPDPYGKDRLRFLRWLLTYGAIEHHLHDGFLEPVCKEWESTLARSGAVAQLRSRSLRWATSAWLRYRPGYANGSRSGSQPRSPLPAPEAQDDSPHGLNVIAYVRSETGVGEGGRSTIRAARAVNLPLAIASADDPAGPYRLGDSSIRDWGSGLPYAANLFHVNADESPAVARKLGLDAAQGKLNIGFWVWELEEFPQRWSSSFSAFDEIWTPSAFSAEAISQKSPIPVLRMPHAIQLEDGRAPGRDPFGLPRDSFVFLAVFDLMSVFERKNPLGVIQAFRELASTAPDCHLVLKINYGERHRDQLERIAQAAAGLPVTILDCTMDRSEINALMLACDCLISLHRSEGFGLTLAEAMYLGKPVIATAYSGNLDFTKPDNSFLVDYQLTAVPPGCAPYDEGQLWADPSVSHAAAQMKTVMHRADLRMERALRGQEFVRTRLSPQAVGSRMKERLAYLAARAGLALDSRGAMPIIEPRAAAAHAGRPR